MESLLADSVVLVLGGSQGVGRATVEAMARDGAEVWLTHGAGGDSVLPWIHSLEARGAKVTPVRADINDAFAMSAVIERIAEESGRLDVIIWNAGEWPVEIDSDPLCIDGWINAAALLMSNSGRGAIVAVARPHAGSPLGTSRMQVTEERVRSWAASWARHGIRVNAVAPGMIESDMSRDVRELAGERILRKILLRRFGTPEDVAGAVRYLASSGAAYVTGTVLHVDGGVGA